MRMRIPGGSLIQSVIALGVISIVTAIGAGLLWLIPMVGPLLSIALFGIGVFCLFFLPIALAFDISDQSPEITATIKSEAALKKLSVRHEYFWVIVIINVLFGLTIIGYVVAFVMAHMPCNADIPPQIAEKLQSDKSKKNSASVSLEDKLQEIERLLKKGLITIDEARMRRETILRSSNI